MGHIKSTPQDNGQVSLEITYGGAEAPFGGIDTSAPPAYIDPKCASSMDGLLVLDNKLVAVALGPVSVPALFSGVASATLIGFGTFYNSVYGQLNYALGYTATAFGTAGYLATGVAYKFYVTAWNPSNIATVYNDVLPVSLYDANNVAQAASITLGVVAPNVPFGATLGASGAITSVDGSGGLLAMTLTGGGTGYSVGDIVLINQIFNPAGVGGFITVNTVGGTGNILTYTITSLGVGYNTTTGGGLWSSLPSELVLLINGTRVVVAYPITPGTIGNAVASMVTEINSYAPINALVKATASSDGLSLVLTAVTPGAAGNAITVQDASNNASYKTAPPFYFACAAGDTLEGGSDSVTAYLAPRAFTKASIAEIGGTLYIGNLGPMILKYGGPGALAVSTLNNGVQVLRKFNGSLVGLGYQGQLGTYTQDSSMIFAWTAATLLDEWPPLNSSNNITGAGYAQLADIGDALTGLVVANNTAFIIRQQGLSYATPLTNGIDPYDFAHLALGDRGEGGQIPGLICQYDQMGCYVGNSNIYGLSGGPSPIGEKIKNSFWGFLATLPDPIPTALATAAQYFIEYKTV